VLKFSQESADTSRRDAGVSKKVCHEEVITTMATRQKSATFQVGRDAKTGRFISVKTAQRRKKTAVVETITKKT